MERGLAGPGHQRKNRGSYARAHPPGARGRQQRCGGGRLQHSGRFCHSAARPAAACAAAG